MSRRVEVGWRRRLGWLVIAVGLLAILAAAVAVAAERHEAEDAAEQLVGHDYYATPAAVCGLFDSDELRFALGYTYSEGFEPPLDYPVFAGIPGVTRCTYTARETVEAFSVGVVYAYAEQLFDDRLERNEEIGDVEEVDGLGDRATWSHAPQELMVLTGDRILLIHPPQQFPSHEERMERTHRLAEKALERLR